MTKPNRKRRIASPATLLIAVGATAAASVVAGILSGYATTAGVNDAVVTGVAVALLLAITFAICVWWWTHLDEAAREAHKWAWWWGGTAGLAIGGVVASVLISPIAEGRLPGAFEALDPAAAFHLGLFGILICQLVGYGVAWAFWWLRRR